MADFNDIITWGLGLGTGWLLRGLLEGARREKLHKEVQVLIAELLHETAFGYKFFRNEIERVQKEVEVVRASLRRG